MYDTVNSTFWWDIPHYVVDEKRHMHSILPAIIKHSDNFYIFLFTCGSMSRTVLRALAVNWWINPAYWTVVELSIVVLIGMPIKKRTALSKWKKKPFWKGFYSGGSSGVSKTRNSDGLMYTFNVDDDYSDNALMALDSFQQLLDFRLPKRKNSYLDMTTKSQNMRKSTKIPTIFLSAPDLCFCKISATLPRNGTAMNGGRFFLSPANKGQLFF